MKRYALLIALILSFGSTLLADPVIKFEKTEHDFGTLNRKTIVKEIFTFKNTGDKELKILKIETSCGCTGTLLSKKEIPAGEEGTLEITFNSGSYNGVVKRTIYIYTNDPDNAEIEIQIKAIVLPK